MIASNNWVRPVTRNYSMVKILLIFLVLTSLAGCQSVYYTTMEKFGVEKRDILVDRVEDARGAQQDAKEQFKSALENYVLLIQVDGGNLEAMYRALQDDFDGSEKRASEVSSRIDSVEAVAEDLFAEWQQELGQYTNKDLRRSSENQLENTQKRYRVLMQAMRKAERRMIPVLDAFRDRVLILKHSLNARAIAALKQQREVIKSDIARLIRDMNRSIDEADRFIKSME